KPSAKNTSGPSHGLPPPYACRRLAETRKMSPGRQRDRPASRGYDTPPMEYSIQPAHRPSFRRRVILGLLMLLAAAVLAAWKRLAGPRLPHTHIASRRTFDAPAAAFSAAEDWPQWRGPRGDAISRETDIVSEFP